MTGMPENQQMTSAPGTAAKTVLVTGATGYIGGRLVPRLLEAGHRVKVLVRTPAKIAGVPWLADVEVIQSSLDDGDALRAALEGVDVFYYLVHSMAGGAGFEAKEKAMARTAAQAAVEAGVDRIVYLGGLHPSDVELSTHMRSREAVGQVFLDSPVDAVVFQAGVVIGSGSASFEMIRHLSETLPVMPAPSWVRNKIEAIAVRDVLHYLLGAASLQGPVNRTFDIGCRQVLSYAAMMQEYAAEAGLPKRFVLALPVPAPKLAGMWVALTTPIPLSMSLPLVESLQHDAVSREHDIDAVIPQPDGGLTDLPLSRVAGVGTGTRRPGEPPYGPTPGPTRTRCPATLIGPATVCTSMTAPSAATWPHSMSGPSSRESAVKTAGTPCPWPGVSGAGSTASRAAPGSAAGAGTPTCWPKAKRLTGGGPSGWNAAASCGSGRKCESRDVPGWSSRWSRREPGAVTGSGRSSSRRVSAGGCTGSLYCRSTA